MGGAAFFCVVSENSHDLNHIYLVDNNVDTSKAVLSSILSIRA